MLACTHYPLLLDRLRKLAPWPVNFIDPAPAIARRVVDLLGPGEAAASPGRPGPSSPPAGTGSPASGLVQRRFDPRFDTPGFP